MKKLLILAACLCAPAFVFAQADNQREVWLSNTGNVTVVSGDVSCSAVKQSNRNSSNTSVFQGFATGSGVSNTVTVGEESVDSIYSGGTAISIKRDYSARNIAGGQSRRNEIILKTDEYYAFTLSNNETSTQGGQIRLEWYEHTPKTD